MTSTTNRLTEIDRRVITRRVEEVAAMWRDSSPTGHVPADPSSMLALVRVGAHAIGCSRLDLRDIEEEWIVSTAWETVQRLNRETRR